MLWNYLKIAWRNIRLQKVYSTINIVGLTVGLSIGLVIAFYVLDDLTFDRFHENADSIYRVVMQSNVEGGDGRMSAIISGPLLPASKREIPEVIAATRINRFGGFPISRGDVERLDDEEGDGVRASILLADSDLFDVFSYKLLVGDRSEFSNPNAVFITPEIASALFGEDDPLGKPLQMPQLENAYVAGLIEAPPNNSHLQFDVIIPLRVELNPVWWDSWKNQSLCGYIRIQDNADVKGIESRMDHIAKTNGFPENYDIRLQPLLDIHLGSSDYAYDFRNYGKKDVSAVIIMGTIGVMIVLVASINFINLSSARASKRGREVGIRKVVGSKQNQLIVQYLGESIFITLVSMILAITILQLALPRLENFLEKRLEIGFFSDPWIMPALIGVAVVVGLLSGIYPALILSSFKPVRVLRGEFQTGKTGILLRRILVIFQFTITVALTVGVLTVISQIKYLQSVDLGYNREQVLFMPNFFRDGEDLMRNRLKDIPSVTSTGRTSRLLGEGLSVQTIPEGFDRTNSLNWYCFFIDDGFFKTLDISMAHGRNFSYEFISDAEDAIIINEAACRLTGWDNPIDRRIDMVMEDGQSVPRRVVGVVRDFHFSSTRSATGPLVFVYNKQRSPILLARLAAGEIAHARNQIEAVHRELYPDRDIRLSFLDDAFDQQFNEDRDFASHLGFFTGIALFIACLGLIGLVSFSVEQRKKEIAVRKVLGCSEGKIVFLLSIDFLKWIGLGSLIAWPLGYYSMQKWLNEFVYRLPFSILPFIISGAGALILAMLTISFQSVMAARANPAGTLRQEL